MKEIMQYRLVVYGVSGYEDDWEEIVDGETIDISDTGSDTHIEFRKMSKGTCNTCKGEGFLIFQPIHTPTK